MAKSVLNIYRSNKPRPRGFTLIEVLIALAIISIALLAILKISNQNIRNYSYLKDKTVAIWVAKNIIAEYQLGLQGHPIRYQAIKSYGVTLYWSSDIAENPQDSTRTLTVSISDKNQGTPILEANSYLPPLRRNNYET